MPPNLIPKVIKLLKPNAFGKIFEKASVPATFDGPPKTKDANVYLFRGLSIVGIQFPQYYKIVYFLWSLFINASVTIYLPTGFVLSFFIRVGEFNPSEFLTSLQVAINCWGCSMKLVIMAFMQGRLKDAEPFMDKLDARCLKDTDDQEKVRKVVAFGNRTFIVFAASYWSYSSSTFITSVFGGRPPYQVYNPFMDWHDGTKQFVMQAFIEYFLMDFTCFQEVVVDSYPVIYINIIRTHLQIVARRITKLGEDKSLNNDERFEELIQCVLDHKNILDLFNTISPVISATIFVQFLIMGCILGFTLINILIFADISAMVASFFYIIAVVFETFPCCYYANCLMDDSDELALAIFHSKWVQEDQRYKKVIAFFLEHTQQTLILTAMKLFPITMNSNLNVAKFAFSVYTMMKQMGFGQNFKDSIERQIEEEHSIERNAI